MLKSKFLYTLLAIFLLSSMATGLYAKTQNLPAQARPIFRGANVDLQRAQRTNSNDDYQIALRKYQQVLELEPNHIQSRKNVADITFMLSENHIPMEEKDMLFAARADYAWILDFLPTLRDWEKYDDFLAIKEDSEKKIQSVFARVFGIGKDFYDDEEFELAELIYLELAELYPNMYQPYQMLAAISNHYGNTEQTIIYQQKILDLAPDNTQILINLANEFEEQEDWENARRYYQLFIEKEPEEPSGYLAIAFVYEQLGDLNKVLENYDIALQFDPDNSAVYSNAAAIAAKLNNTDREIEYLKKWAELDQQEENLEYMCQRLVRLQRWSDVVHFAKLWHQINPEDIVAIEFVIYGSRQLNDTATVREFEAKK